MSQIVDTRFTPEEREALLTEVRDYLPAFLSAATTQQHDPVGDVRELLGLSALDLGRVIATHICLSEPVVRFFAVLRAGLMQPITSSLRPPVVSQAVRGAVDWGATIRQRSLAGGDRTLYVTRPARRVFDVPENRALVWLLSELDRNLRAASVRQATHYDAEQTQWGQVMRAQRGQVIRANRTSWLREVPAERPSAATMQRLASARTEFYARNLTDAIRAVRRWGETPSEADLTELLCQRYFRPNEDWRLFEVTVALRLARGFAEASPHKRQARLLVGTTAAFARYRLAAGDQVAVYYQSWPEAAGPSRHAETRTRHKLAAGAPRPDLFIVRSGAEPDAAVLELKASRKAGTLGAGLSQLLSYLHEYPEAWHRKPAGWLVAPASAAYESADAGDAELWVVNANDVANAAVARFA